MEVLMRVQSYLKRTGMPPTLFGRRIANDPRLVLDMQRMGREPRAPMIAKIEAFIAQHPDGLR